MVKHHYQVALVVKKPPANAGDVRDMGSIPETGKPLVEGMATHSTVLVWRVPQSEEPGGLQSIESQEDRQDRSSCTCVRASG